MSPCAEAAHQIHDAKPLVFEDPFAVPILPPDARAPSSSAHLLASRKPFSAATLRRLHGLPRALCRGTCSPQVFAIHGVRQALILGAGLDTVRAAQPLSEPTRLRGRPPGQRNQLEARDPRDREACRFPTTLTHVPVDFERANRFESNSSQHAGFDFTIPTATAWLGVVPYLTPEAFAATARVLGSLPPGSSLVFDYSEPREALSFTEGDSCSDSLSARVAAGRRALPALLHTPSLSPKS